MSKWLRRAALALVSAGMLLNYGCSVPLLGSLTWSKVMQQVIVGNLFD
jgi:hypothetical protein